jgi:hypothetical protein
MVPGPALQEMDAVDADTYFGVVAQADEGVIVTGAAAAPAPALTSLLGRCMGFSAHGGSLRSPRCP